ncbi:MAG: hypothetical protein M3161_00570 [Actinomycetota bacterium]|nr:hypothetical protein [Actinomycetota bacterium]
MPVLTARVALAVLVAVFAWAAAAKLLRRASWARALEGYAFPRPLGLAALWITPLVEAAIVVLAVAGRARAAAGLGLILLGAFTLAILRARSFHGERLPCGCFGQTTERPVSLMLWRNGALGACAVAVLAADADVTLFEGMRAPTASEALPVALVVIGIGLAAWSLRTAFTSLRGRT